MKTHTKWPLLLVLATLGAAWAAESTTVVIENASDAAAWSTGGGTGANIAASSVTSTTGEKDDGSACLQFTYAHTAAVANDYIRFVRNLIEPLDLSKGTLQVRMKSAPTKDSYIQLQLIDANGGFLEYAFNKPGQFDGQWHTYEISLDQMGKVKNPDIKKLVSIRFESVGDASKTEFTAKFFVDRIEVQK